MKYLNDFKEEEFNLLSDLEIKKIIEFEIIKYSSIDPEKSKFINDVILNRFENKFYTGGMKNFLYKDLTFHEEKQIRGYVHEQKEVKKKFAKTIENTRKDSEDKEKSLSSKVISTIFYMWILNTFFANVITADKNWEGWYIPGLSEITPILVQETYLIGGSSKFRLASQAEVWRTNRRYKQLKEGIDYFLK